MAVSVRIKGQDRLNAKLRRMTNGIGSRVGKAIATSAAEVQREAILSIRGGSRSGVVVTIGGKPHQRSAPGERPKTDTGALVGSIFAEVDLANRDKPSAAVGTDLKHGAFLEFGTLKMGARPWLQPAFEGLKSKIRKRIAQAVRAGSRTGRK